MQNIHGLCLLLLAALLAGCRTADDQRTVATSREVRALYTQTVVEREAGRYDDMRVLLSRVLELRPDMPEALYDMARLKYTLCETGDSLYDARTLAEADSLLGRAVALKPRNTLFLTEYADVALRRGDDSLACALYERLCAEAPNEERLTRLAYLYTKRGQYAAAYSAYERIEALEGDDFQYTLAKVRLLMQQDRKDEALELAARRAAAQPLENESQIMYATMLSTHGDTLQALAIADDVLRRDPGLDVAQGLRISLSRGTDGPAADSIWARRFMLQPATDEEVRVRYFNLLAQRGAEGNYYSQNFLGTLEELADVPGLTDDFCSYVAYVMNMRGIRAETKIRVLEGFLRTNPQQKTLRYSLLNELIRAEQPQELLRVCLDGLRTDTADLILAGYAAQTLYQTDREDEAIEQLERSTRSAQQAGGFDEEIMSDNLSLLGDIYHAQGRSADAFRAYEEALRHNPNNDLCRNNYAYFLSLTEGGDIARAEELMAAVVAKEKNKTNAVYLDTYAYVLFVAGKLEQAKIYMDEVMRYLPEASDEESGRAVYFEHAGDIAAALGDTAAARDYWQQALSRTNDPDDQHKLRLKLQQK